MMLACNDARTVSGQQMNDAQQLALAMFVLACAALTLIVGQLYMEHGSPTTSASRHVQAAPLSISSPEKTSSRARRDLVAASRS
jgi:hypothetical protein